MSLLFFCVIQSTYSGDILTLPMSILSIVSKVSTFFFPPLFIT